MNDLSQSVPRYSGHDVAADVAADHVVPMIFHTNLCRLVESRMVYILPHCLDCGTSDKKWCAELMT